MSLWSTGLRTALLGGAVTGYTGKTGVKGIFSGFSVIKLYSGAIPATADAAETGTLLGTIVNDVTAATPAFPANCLVFSDPSSGSLSKNSDSWGMKGANITSGTPTHWRLVVNYATSNPYGAAVDDGTLSTTQMRIQGTFGSGGAELNTGTGVLVNGTDQPISYCNISFPVGM